MGDIETIFKVPGRPYGKARPRFNRNTGNVYSPDAGNFEARVAEHGMAAGLVPQEGPFEVAVVIKRLMAKSWSKKKKANLCYRPMVGKPDGVNVMAALLDGLQGVAYHDDSQVARLSCTRAWSPDEDSTTITVRKLVGGNDGA